MIEHYHGHRDLNDYIILTKVPMPSLTPQRMPMSSLKLHDLKINNFTANTFNIIRRHLKKVIMFFIIKYGQTRTYIYCRLLQ